MTEEIKKADSKDLEDSQPLTYLSYVGLLFLVPLLAKRESKFAQFHAKQGMTLYIGLFVILFAVAFVAWIPFIGWMVMMLVYPAAIIFTLVCMILGLINVSRGEMKPLPVVGDLAEKIKF
ncbi:DUF4870 domain-containing protein [Patescibacteria group bacterium]|nr:DUF4870 domain-containing protein [Patescibacteria group bacterium]